MILEENTQALNGPGLQPILLKPPEAAKLLRVSPSKLYAMLAAGVIPAVRVGHSLRVPIAALERWIEEHTVEAGRS